MKKTTFLSNTFFVASALTIGSNAIHAATDNVTTAAGSIVFDASSENPNALDFEYC